MAESFSQGSGVSVHFKPDSTLPTIHSEKNGLKQVFINLMQNAVEAMPGGGNIYIETRPLAKRTGEETGDRSWDAVEISFRDDGPGIPEAVKTRLFEPFVTSKKGAHAGLGLSVAYNIIKDLRGDITCESGSNTGTTFTVALPVELKRAA
jgi:signal transduction histidine kinase